MQTWALAPPRASFQCERGDSLSDVLCAVTDAIGESDFAVCTLRLINAALPVDFMSVYRIAGDSPPQMFFSASRTAHDVSADCMRRYRGGLYRRDETFSRARELAARGALAMTHWNEAEIPSPHRDQIYRRHGIQERLSVVNADSPDDMLAINLYRFDDTGRFRDHEIDAAQAIGRPVLSCVKKHLQVLGKLKRVSQNPASNARLVLLERCPALTARELDVCERLCRGWTYDGIALDLGLSVPTVKTYRTRAFDRLGIHFRNELFSIVAGIDRSA